MSDFDWNESAVNRLRQMIADGYTDGQIARAWNVTRNTINGKRKRLGLIRGEPSDIAKTAATIPQPARKSRAKPPEERKQRGRPKAPKHMPLPTLAEMKAPRALPKDEPITETAVTTLAMQPGQCKWPLNDGKPQWLHCGATASDGPYCSHHARRSSGSGTYSERSAA